MYQIGRTEVIFDEEKVARCEFLNTLFLPSSSPSSPFSLCIFDVSEVDPENLSLSHPVGTVRISAQEVSQNIGSSLIRPISHVVNSVGPARIGVMMIRCLSAECCAKDRAQSIRAWYPSTSYSISGFLVPQAGLLNSQPHLQREQSSFFPPHLNQGSGAPRPLHSGVAVSPTQSQILSPPTGQTPNSLNLSTAGLTAPPPPQNLLSQSAIGNQFESDVLLHCHEHLIESKYAFRVPFLFLQLIVCAESNKLFQLEKRLRSFRRMVEKEVGKEKKGEKKNEKKHEKINFYSQSVLKQRSHVERIFQVLYLFYFSFFRQKKIVSKSKKL